MSSENILILLVILQILPKCLAVPWMAVSNLLGKYKLTDNYKGISHFLLLWRLSDYNIFVPVVQRVLDNAIYQIIYFIHWI